VAIALVGAVTAKIVGAVAAGARLSQAARRVAACTARVWCASNAARAPPASRRRIAASRISRLSASNQAAGVFATSMPPIVSAAA
jgi:hypothetical protein